MESNILLTRQLRVLRASEEESEIDKIKREADPGTMAATVIDLLEVTGVAESVENDGRINADQTILMYGSEEVVVESSYDEVSKRWINLMTSEGEIQEEPRAMDLGAAVARLARELEIDRNSQVGEEDPNSLYYGYQSNIATAFYDEYLSWRRKSLGETYPLPETERLAIHKIANKGAKRFLNMFINSIKTPQNESH